MSGASEQIEDSKISEAIRWRVRLSDKAPQKSWAIGTCALLAFVVGTFLFRNVGLGVVGFAIISGSTAEFWLGTSFQIDKKGATVRTGLSVAVIDWSDVKRVLFDANGIKLSPLEDAGTMDAFRGVYLRYGAGNQERIERAVLNFGKLSDKHVVGRPDGGRDGSPHPEGDGRDLSS